MYKDSTLQGEKLTDIQIKKDTHGIIQGFNVADTISLEFQETRFPPYWGCSVKKRCSKNGKWIYEGRVLDPSFGGLVERFEKGDLDIEGVEVLFNSRMLNSGEMCSWKKKAGAL